MYKSAEWQVAVCPKQKHLIHSSGDRASELKEPTGHTVRWLTINIVSGTANVVPLMLIASQEYAPWSSIWISGQINLPTPLSLVDRHFGGTWPQLRRHTTSGAGTPTAVHEISKSAPTSRVTLGGGGEIMIGFAIKWFNYWTNFNI